MDHVGIIRN